MERRTLDHPCSCENRRRSCSLSARRGRRPAPAVDTGPHNSRSAWDLVRSPDPVPGLMPRYSWPPGLWLVFERGAPGLWLVFERGAPGLWLVFERGAPGLWLVFERGAPGLWLVFERGAPGLWLVFERGAPGLWLVFERGAPGLWLVFERGAPGLWLVFERGAPARILAFGPYRPLGLCSTLERPPMLERCSQYSGLGPNLQAPLSRWGPALIRTPVSLPAQGLKPVPERYQAAGLLSTGKEWPAAAWTAERGGAFA